MSDDPLLSTAQLHACLRTIGVELPVPDPMPRAVALGMLLYCVEGAATIDTDRLDLEAVREGYLAGIRNTLHADGDENPNALSGVWSRLLQARVNRTLTDLTATQTDDDGQGYTVAPAVNHLLDAAQTLLSTSNPPPHIPPQQQLHNVRNALRTARREVQAARQQIEDGRKVLRSLGLEP
ncbi:hypothetical protein QMK19_38950 [Streptomyces sp. H10-C2]|uniref:hypothetical protein n=1 Tax=unclassified Streptomyces TaxID=2593676 RepID=UPI0024B927A7|nr:MULTISPECIES: hypothetical protein [unclassified Streptomyces]MDJ0347155.1 hypothetical protein [Streptomyces sp. PH10-H1]MDJ0375414.1 hypothetical protein [Streptomyces sp. H10-C2]